ncbi:histone lysine demethylase PHF8 isoform X2 [Parasteatoda tepidariorum]|uniref:histone lysine demethylase PHF8 isoform X2 n=1 Tax=Parasteatoda tepidariorum TaxID=114398 RepID=UPI001C72341F|nr:histone lysine demethylase PHF8 isoform X2 [Parasteatoda tepidariorum]
MQSFSFGSKIMASRTVYCICGEPYDSVRFMIQCDSCKDWYHGSCVNVKEHESLDIEKYHCVQCQRIAGPSIYREVKNYHRHDYGDCNADGKGLNKVKHFFGIEAKMAVQSGTPVFVKELRSRHFKSAEEVIIRLRGPQLSLPYLIQHGFSKPILVDSKVGLGIQMPSDTFTVSDVMDYVGPNFPLDVIDVARQDNIRMPMSEWVEYFNNPIRSKVYNVISLEFSKTRLAELIKPPTIVQKLSWVENYWPKNSETHTPFCPQVMKYCLMSAQDSYTDFHIDFGGTSVWYHILRGEKVFFLIQPTPANLALYEHWMASSNQSETFFGDQVDVCYQMLLTHGQTLFIPTGWIHAVLTPVDSLVFGGNFLHSLNIPLQLHIHEMEKRINTPEKYKFPTFETVHWFAAPHILDQLKDNNVSKRELTHLVSGAKALVSVLKIWSSDSQNHKHDDVPPGINVTKLIKDLQREVRVAEKYSSSKNPLVATRKAPLRQRRKEPVQRAENVMKMAPTESEKNLDLVSKFSLTSKTLPNSDNFYDGLNFNQAQSSGLQFNLQDSKIMFDKMNIDLNSLMEASSMKDGSIINRTLSVPFGIACKEDNFSLKKDSVYDFVDSDDDNLVVDENPTNNKKRKEFKKDPFAQDAYSDMQSSALRLRLSFNGKGLDAFNPGSILSPPQDDSNAETPKNATIDDLLVATGLAVDGESSASLDDVELNGGQTQLEPSTRDAIQGMLSMSKGAIRFPSQGDPSEMALQGLHPPLKTENYGSESVMPHMDSSLANLSILARKSSPPIRNAKVTLGLSRYSNNCDEEVDEFEEQLKQCHQEGDYIYLGLEGSDDECHVFKPRGRNRRDEPWNPKAKLVPNCPKPERPVREGTRKEAIETGLAAAAAKLATMPPQKRQYLKKKPVNRNKIPAPDLQPGPSTSVFNNNNKRPLPSESIKVNKRPKKGFATAKQRLGKILKIHKMLY